MFFFEIVFADHYTNWKWSASSGALSQPKGTHDAMVNRFGNAKKGEKFIFQAGRQKRSDKVYLRRIKNGCSVPETVL